MNAVVQTLRVTRHAALVGWRDEQVIYTWRTWLTGWFLRVIAQVIFYALIGLLLDSQEALHFILVGNAIMLTAVSSSMTVATTTWERRAGTLPLLLAAPSSHTTVFITRSLRQVFDATITAVGGFFVAAPLFGLPLPWPRVLLLVPLIVLISLTTYLFACFLGALALWAMDWRNIISNTVRYFMMAICGVNVPLSALPDWVVPISRSLPLTHGLMAVRDVLGGAGAGAVMRNVGLEALVGAAWLLAAIPVFWWLGEQGRRDGTIEFGA
jgi:ABC-2 type transport system permease protein